MPKLGLFSRAPLPSHGSILQPRYKLDAEVVPARTMSFYNNIMHGYTKPSPKCAVRQLDEMVARACRSPLKQFRFLDAVVVFVAIKGRCTTPAPLSGHAPAAGGRGHSVNTVVGVLSSLNRRQIR